MLMFNIFDDNDNLTNTFSSNGDFESLLYDSMTTWEANDIKDLTVSACKVVNQYLPSAARIEISTGRAVSIDIYCESILDKRYIAKTLAMDFIEYEDIDVDYYSLCGNHYRDTTYHVDLDRASVMITIR